MRSNSTAGTTAPDASGGSDKAHCGKQGGTRRTRARAGAAGARRAGALRGGARGDLYEEVTASIIRQLESGRVPWVQPWSDGIALSGGASGPAPGLPANALTGRSYSGINVLILWGAVFENGWSSQGWLTFRQALEAGGCVRKGEHGTGVVYADRFVPETEKKRARETGEDARTVPFLKRFTVFNGAP